MAKAFPLLFVEPIGEFKNDVAKLVEGSEPLPIRGTMLIQYQGQAMWNEVGTLALLIVAVVWSMDTASAYLRESLR